jgi:NTP pyrophosphatase (non-canonical NTP hydrolase)
MKHRDPEILFKHGNRAQEEKLIENSHKPGWDDIGIHKAISLTYAEVEELLDCLNSRERYTKEHLKEIRREAADVANFAHMTIYAVDKALKELSI